LLGLSLWPMTAAETSDGRRRHVRASMLTEAEVLNEKMMNVFPKRLPPALSYILALQDSIVVHSISNLPAGSSATAR
jgi:hypothetical protein